MSGPQVAMLAGGRRLHLQHGPIDLIIEAWGAAGQREIAHRAAVARFCGLLAELVAELPLLKRPCPPHGLGLCGPVARRMEAAVQPFAAAGSFITPMAAVAGAVAEEVLECMLAAAALDKAYVNNGGDIAMHLAGSQRFDIAMISLDAMPGDAGRIAIAASDGVRGIATSGRHGRSLSMGIADSVTVLAAGAATADAAATLVANAVDLPGHRAIERRPASALADDSDLGLRLVVTHVGELSPDEIEQALARGLAAGEAMRVAGHIVGAAVLLKGRSKVAGPTGPGATCRLPGAFQPERTQGLHA